MGVTTRVHMGLEGRERQTPRTPPGVQGLWSSPVGQCVCEMGKEAAWGGGVGGLSRD